MDIHREVNPQYLTKLEKIKKQKGIKFKTIEEFDAYFSDEEKQHVEFLDFGHHDEIYL